MTGEVGFHAGELAVQRRAGVSTTAARLSPMLATPDLDGGAHRFLAERELAFVTARDRAGRLWTSPLLGRAGFLDGRQATLRVHAVPGGADPLAGIAAGQPIGLLAIDLATRRRLRVNGTLTAAGPGELEISADQAFGNCPQYIQTRQLEHTGGAEPARVAAPPRTELTPDAIGLIRAADTFILGTTHPERGVDTSHRGGAAGFVRVEGGAVWWPDYPGNNLFNNLGNLAVDPSAALLFVDFATGATLHLSGKAAIEWVAPGSTGDDGGTGRRVRFTPHAVTGGATLAVRATGVLPHPRNPTLTGRAATP